MSDETVLLGLSELSLLISGVGFALLKRYVPNLLAAMGPGFALLNNAFVYMVLTGLFVTGWSKEALLFALIGGISLGGTQAALHHMGKNQGPADKA